VSGIGHRWSRLPPKSRAVFTLAAFLLGGGVCLLGEGLYFRAQATREEGTVVDHDTKGRPVVELTWAGQPYRLESRGPSERIAVGTKVTVFVPLQGPSAARLDTPMALLFLPGWVCLMPATFLIVYGTAVAVWRKRSPAEPGAAPEPGLP
jgi:hypothetical protein